MADDLEITSANSVRQTASPRVPAQVVVSFDGDSGAMTPTSVDGRATGADKRVDILARAQERIDAARGGPREAVQMNEHGAVIAPGEGEGGESEVEEGTEAAEGDAEPADGGDAEQAEQAEEPAPPPAPTSYELDQLRVENATLRRLARDQQAATREEEFDTFSTDPVGWLKGRISQALGVAADDPLVAAEAEHLFGELTYAAIDVQSLPDQQKASLRSDRADRNLRLDAHRRKATKQQTQQVEQAQRAQGFVKSVFESAKDETGTPLFPNAPLAERKYGRPLHELIVEVLHDGIEKGYIENWQSKTEKELVHEAIRLIDTDAHEWARELGPRLAPLLSATAPAAPGASSKAPAAKKNASAPATPNKGQIAKPRTLAPQQAGAAPTRPGTKPAPADLPLDSQARARAIIARHAK